MNRTLARLSKSTGDSTRFTATGVWARPGMRKTTLEFAGPAPKGETPQQKVKRLREAANRAKMAQVTKWDVMYFYGRTAADFAHRATVYGIVFATGCIGVLAVFAIGDMVVYNRRKRAMFFEQQEKIQADILARARDAVSGGYATPAQTALVEGIAEEERLWQEKQANRKAPSKLLWWLHGDWKEEEELKKQRQLAVQEFQRKQEAEQQQQQLGVGVTQAVQEARATGAPVVLAAQAPGPLDQAAEKTVEKIAEKTSSGWFSWLTGSGSKTA